ncbi:MAG TPA: hypothetical protein VIB99_02980 [Candidatus Limnocylindrales bacterium]
MSGGLTRGEAWATAGLLFVAALLVRIAFARTVPFPTPEDTAYYVMVARNLVQGHGLTSDALWSYQTPPLVFPRPAFEVWLPLPTFLIALPMAVLGASFGVAQLPALIIGALIPVLAWRLAADVAVELGLPAGRARTLAIGAGLTAAVELPLVLFSALPDSTALFTLLALSACLVIHRLLKNPRGARLGDPRLIALGALIGLAALTRNEAVWLGLTWAGLAWFARGSDGARLNRSERLRLIAVPAVIAIVIFTPWLIRDWLVFGNPLPGQAAANALSVTGFDIFAWNDPPTLARYLAVGLAGLVQMRIDGFVHNLFSVLLIPSFPIGLIGLLRLPWTVGIRSLRPLLILSLLTFWITTLVFPVSTTWGTFLHAAGPVQVLLIVTCLLAFDALFVRVSAWRGWTKEVAWLGATLTVATAILFSLGLASYGQQSADTAARYQALDAQMALIGRPLEEAGPIIADFPIWLAYNSRINTLALPDEAPASVVDLAIHFSGTQYLVISGDHGSWPAVLAEGGPAASCFHEVALGTPADPATAAALAGTRVFQIGCAP